MAALPLHPHGPSDHGAKQAVDLGARQGYGVAIYSRPGSKAVISPLLRVKTGTGNRVSCSSADSSNSSRAYRYLYIDTSDIMAAHDLFQTCKNAIHSNWTTSG